MFSGPTLPPQLCCLFCRVVWLTRVIFAKFKEARCGACFGGDDVWPALELGNERIKLGPKPYGKSAVRRGSGRPL